MEDAKQQIVEKLQNANNILVTVSANPTVDQLAACIGLTLLLNKMNKHATAVFSGKVPSTIEFLKPEETIETNTDSLRDFIISLDKAKADKLRYKVEDEVVKIFITPYKASINDKDLIFSQGDFNVDVVIALGVRQAQDLDNAITAHGRILHDAVVISINTSASGGALGGINWVDAGASGLAELVTTLAGNLGQNVLDAQIATALLTGIVAQTEHFSNQKTTPTTMTSSAALLAAGANQQLVSKELAPKAPPAVAAPAPAQIPAAVPQVQVSADGELDVPHAAGEKPPKKPVQSTEPKPQTEKPAAKTATPVPAQEPAAVEQGESNDTPDRSEPASGDAAAKPASTEASTSDPEDKLTSRMKRIEPLHHDAPTPLKLDDDPVLTIPAPAVAEGAEPIETPVAQEEPVEHEEPEAPTTPTLTGIVEPTEPPEPDAPSKPLVLDDKSDDSLDALLQNVDAAPVAEASLPAPAAPELPLPNPAPTTATPPPNAPIIEVPPAPESVEPVIEAAEAKEEQEAQVSSAEIEEQLAKLEDTTAKPDESSETTEPAPLDIVEPTDNVSDADTEPAKPAEVTPEPAPATPAPEPAPKPSTPTTPEIPADDSAPENSTILSDIEKSVHSPHAEDDAETDVDSARKAVEDALKSAPDQTLEPLAAVGAVNVDIDLGHDAALQPPIPESQPGPGMPEAGLPDYLQTPLMAPAPNGNAAASNMPPFEDLASTPMMGGIQTPPPQTAPPTSTSFPPQGPPATPPPLP